MDNHQEESSTKGNDSGVDELLQLKDRALNVAAEGITISDMRSPDQPLMIASSASD